MYRSYFTVVLYFVFIWTYPNTKLIRPAYSMHVCHKYHPIPLYWVSTQYLPASAYSSRHECNMIWLLFIAFLLVTFTLCPQSCTRRVGKSSTPGTTIMLITFTSIQGISRLLAICQWSIWTNVLLRECQCVLSLKL